LGREIDKGREKTREGKGTEWKGKEGEGNWEREKGKSKSRNWGKFASLTLGG